MQVKVRLFATFASRAPEGKAGVPFETELPPGTTLHELVRRMALPETELKLNFVNGRAEDLSHELKEGDEVGIFPAVGGG